MVVSEVQACITWSHLQDAFIQCLPDWRLLTECPAQHPCQFLRMQQGTHSMKSLSYPLWLLGVSWHRTDVLLCCVAPSCHRKQTVLLFR